ncbi:MAG: hypothetical protein NXI00_06945 [Cytophagales bacterium]|nr:hypothetical protein [Cytophagales bacterium]
MPTIEIASVNSTGLSLNQDEFVVAIVVENKLESHRGLFYDFLLKQNGTIIHIGNPDLRFNKNGGYFAGQIIDWDFDDPDFDNKREVLISNEDNSYANQDFNFQFRLEYKVDINRILKSAIDSSPEKKIYFLTDYQFGPKNGSFKTLENIRSLWEVHDNEGLTWNTLYELKEKK